MGPLVSIILGMLSDLLKSCKSNSSSFINTWLLFEVVEWFLVYTELYENKATLVGT